MGSAKLLASLYCKNEISGKTTDPDPRKANDKPILRKPKKRILRKPDCQNPKNPRPTNPKKASSPKSNENQPALPLSFETDQIQSC
jgi:hypothetical protein